MKKAITLLFVIIIVFITLPRFFEIYRSMSFNTVPRDDYAPYLLSISGGTSDFEMYSPYGYRFFSYALALPFYKTLPVYTFTNLVGVDKNYLAATQALALTSYLAILASCYLIYLISRNRLKLAAHHALLTGLLAYLLFEFTSMVGVDPIAILVISLGVYFLEQPVPFSLLVILSAGFNEKISILFFMLLLARFLVQRKGFALWTQLVSSATSLGLYFVIRALVRLPGFEHQTSIDQFFSSFVITLKDTFSMKGVVLNVIPILIVLSMALIAALLPSKRTEGLKFTKADILPFFGLVILAFFVRLEYTVGRIAMFCFPLYLPYAWANLADHLKD